MFNSKAVNLPMHKLSERTSHSKAHLSDLGYLSQSVIPQLLSNKVIIKYVWLVAIIGFNTSGIDIPI